MFPPQDTLTLDALLADPLTRLVMRSDNLTPEDVAQAFDQARAGLAHRHGMRHTCSLSLAGEERSHRWNAC